MENRSYSPNKKTTKLLNVYIDPQITSDFSELSLFDIASVSEEDSNIALYKRNNRLWINYPDGNYCDFPYYAKNIRAILQGQLDQKHPEVTDSTFDHFLKNAQSIEKKIYSSVSLSPDENVKDLWDELIKKINVISKESHSIRSLMEKLLEVPFLNMFESSLIILHLKGQSNSELLGVVWRTEKTQHIISVRDFNVFFNSVKKSKIKSFSTDAFPKINLPFNGTFLAKEATSRKYSMVAVASRHDFLSYSDEEIELFEMCIDLLQPHFERLIDQEFSDKKISELRVCFNDFPLPLRLKDSLSGTAFLNDLYDSDLQEKDIFFTKKLNSSFTIDLYDSDELRHYAFDLFHFQRISLLGELLNTLRHELSNPLFGLKLGSQMFSMIEANDEGKEIMKEIEKSINRCQSIIENFSNLYQAQSENRPVILKKIIDEAIILSKSESRDIRKHIQFKDGTDEIQLEIPMIFVVQIIFNLIVNAAQAMRNKAGSKEIIIDVSVKSNFINIDVNDSGPGIPDEQINQLFKPFFTTKSSGTGLGLVLSRNLAIKMCGNLEYINDNPNGGAHFRLTLPIK